MLDRTRLSDSLEAQKALFCNLGDADLAAHALNAVTQLEVDETLKGPREHFYLGVVHELANRLLERAFDDVDAVEPAVIQSLIDVGSANDVVNVVAGRYGARTRMRQRMLLMSEADLVATTRFQMRRLTSEKASKSETLLVTTLIPEILRRLGERRPAAA